MKNLRTTAILIGLAIYLIAFYATPMPSFANDAGESMWRIQLVLIFLFRPDEWLWANWFGVPAQFAVADTALPIGCSCCCRPGSFSRGPPLWGGCC